MNDRPQIKLLRSNTVHDNVEVTRSNQPKKGFKIYYFVNTKTSFGVKIGER
jgi:hypothetical protein